MVAVQIGAGGVEFDALAYVRVHPAAEMFPVMTGPALEELVEDIRRNGLREPVVFTPDGALLDGRNRYRACAEAEVEPARRVERSEPWSYVITTNLPHHNLSDNQRKMIGARIAERGEGQPARGYIKGIPTQKQLAELLGVSKDGIERARKLVTRGIKPLQRAVEDGALPLTTAARIADLAPQEQAEELERALQARPAVPQQRKPPRSSGGRGPTYYNRSDVLNRDSLVKIVSTLGGLAAGLRDITALPPDLKTDEARAYAREIRAALGEHRKLIRFLEQHDKKEQAA